jgi:hypothetical protein
VTAASEDSPDSVQVVGSSSSSVLVSWTPPSTPNGAILTYTLYISFSEGSPVTRIQSGAAATNYTVMNLEPYQLVSVMISASTAAGEGPASEPATGRARELGMFSVK